MDDLALLDVPDDLLEAVLAEELARASTSRRDATYSTWREWVSAMFPSYVRDGFAPRHDEFWDWAWAIEPDVRPRPFIAVWPRGGAKSTTAELVTTMLATRGKRRYALYVCSAQDQADKHVSNMAAMLESIGVERALNKYGSSKGWRRNRLRTSDGFTLDALGLDVAARGAKVDEWRPDVITFDDIDERGDSKAQTNQKEVAITQNILQIGRASWRESG